MDRTFWLYPEKKELNKIRLLDSFKNNSNFFKLFVTQVDEQIFTKGETVNFIWESEIICPNFLKSIDIEFTFGSNFDNKKFKIGYQPNNFNVSTAKNHIIKQNLWTITFLEDTIWNEGFVPFMVLITPNLNEETFTFNDIILS